MADNMDIETTILTLLESVKEIKEANEKLLVKVKTHEEKNEIISDDINFIEAELYCILLNADLKSSYKILGSIRLKNV